MHRSRAGGVADWFSACSGVFSVFLEFTWSVGPRAVPQSAHVLYAQRARSRDREQLRVSVTFLDPLRPRVAENPAPGLGRIRGERSYLPGNSRRVFPGDARASARRQRAAYYMTPWLIRGVTIGGLVAPPIPAPSKDHTSLQHWGDAVPTSATSERHRANAGQPLVIYSDQKAGQINLTGKATIWLFAAN